MYRVAERFFSVQGEGAYTGTPMAFIRFVGCSVGKKVCHSCDTAFEAPLPWRHGGEFEAVSLADWAGRYGHVCLTGGEPLDQDLEPLLNLLDGRLTHIETSGTVPLPEYLDRERTYVTVSPKPGYLEAVVQAADEVKVIVPGLGNGEGWPTLDNALEWASAGLTVYLQPRNGRFDVDKVNLRYVQDLVAQYPQLRLSVQMHKILGVQ